MSAPKRSGVSCSYKNCTARFNRGGEGVHFFRFPNNGDLCKLWLQACGREDLPSLEYQHYHKTRRVCSNHFENRMYMGPSKSRLLPTAVPKQIESDTNIQEESGNNPEFQPPAKILVVDIAAISGPSHQGNITSIGFDASVQTPASISAGTPRKRFMQQVFIPQNN
ncbi:52 kDa repressor of the inhibitor of the protein kinase-like isoform X1 [Osmia bicornis bicornis]|uniref:52 kDa repressor of the inhibitor of the protein kinase-like isoform X1 n=1 Tax=Osmia bicornis bicornis TaxID=1437191 RepID=UPI001EAE9C30|nr:52 kDa repressor of the inhibitor of the protein kinase-like isoform X1 [Osmia bicornis bicornis]